MIVSDSDVLLAALDRRLEVERVAALAPTGVVADPARDAPAAALVPRVDPSTAGALDRLPLGLVFEATVVGGRGDGGKSESEVLVDLGSLRAALSWPAGSATPATGARIALRVLAREPSLLLEHVVADESAARDDADVPLRLSGAARALQATASAPGAVLRFAQPVIGTGAAPRAAIAGGPTDAAATAAAVVSANGGDGSAQAAETAGPANTTTATASAPVVPPIILQGPAWVGQDLELVVRRERRDEAFDNPALDQWCGELVIDLPALGRVAGHLAWSMQGLRIRLEGRDAASVASMNGTSADLARALADVDLPVIGLSIGLPATASAPDGGPRG